ncbi:hypothetical protein Trydic_g17490 [Trypoxylus dichotomus]
MVKLQHTQQVFSSSVSNEPVAMEGLPEIDMIKLSGVLFKFVGESKRSTTIVLRCFRIFNIVTIGIALWFAFVNFFFVEGEMYVQALQSTMLFAHVLLKYLSLLVYKGSIRDLLIEIVNGFWNYRCCSRDIRHKIEKIHRTVERFQSVMLIITAFCVVVYMVKPFLAVNRGLLLEAFVHRSNVIDAILLLSQFYCFCVAAPVVLGYDFIYFALCAHIILQFRLLKHKINNALTKHDKETASQIRVCVRHHQFLFTRTNFTNYIAKLVTVLVFVGQFTLYAFPAEQVASEIMCDNDSILEPTYFDKTWYRRSQFILAKTFLSVMRRFRQQMEREQIVGLGEDGTSFKETAKGSNGTTKIR